MNLSVQLSQFIKMTDRLRAVQCQGDIECGNCFLITPTLGSCRIVPMSDSTKRLGFSLGDADCDLGPEKSAQIDDLQAWVTVERSKTTEEG